MRNGKKYWAVKRSGPGDGLTDGSNVFNLQDADFNQFPWVVMTSKSISALGEMICVCPRQSNAEEIANALNSMDGIRAVFRAET